MVLPMVPQRLSPNAPASYIIGALRRVRSYFPLTLMAGATAWNCCKISSRLVVLASILVLLVKYNSHLNTVSGPLHRVPSSRYNTLASLSQADSSMSGHLQYSDNISISDILLRWHFSCHSFLPNGKFWNGCQKSCQILACQNLAYQKNLPKFWQQNFF